MCCCYSLILLLAAARAVFFRDAQSDLVETTEAAAPRCPSTGWTLPCPAAVAVDRCCTTLRAIVVVARLSFSLFLLSFFSSLLLSSPLHLVRPRPAVHAAPLTATTPAQEETIKHERQRRGRTTTTKLVGGRRQDGDGTRRRRRRREGRQVERCSTLQGGATVPVDIVPAAAAGVGSACTRVALLARTLRRAVCTQRSVTVDNGTNH